MSALPIMTPFELTLENELNVEVERFNNNWLFKWYGMTYEGGQTDVEDFRGGRIHYAGIKFEYQQQQSFSAAIDRYLDRKVHDTFRDWDFETRLLPNEIRLRSIEGVDRSLSRFVARISELGKETDRRLRGKACLGSRDAIDESVPHVYTMSEISNLATSHRMLLQHAIESAKSAASPRVPKLRWLEALCTENRGLIWFIGGMASVGTVVVGYFLH